MATRNLNRLRDERNRTNTEILGKEQLIARLPNPDSNEGLILRGQVAQLRELIDQLDDEIAKADVLEKKRTKKTNWSQEQPHVDDAIDRNFMGYTTTNTQLMIGLGVSSISDSWTAFAQNEKVLEDYYDRLDKNEIPIYRGHLLNEEDLIIRRIK
jgi:coproporphyrinogen III oxidase-like Fe-S oxidoreductase